LRVGKLAERNAADEDKDVDKVEVEAVAFEGIGSGRDVVDIIGEAPKELELRINHPCTDPGEKIRKERKVIGRCRCRCRMQDDSNGRALAQCARVLVLASNRSSLYFMALSRPRAEF
jgi:hypothetical protein